MDTVTKVIQAVTKAISAAPAKTGAIVVTVVVIGAGAATVGLNAAGGTTRTPEHFCQVYTQQKQQYLARYPSSPQSPDLNGLVTGIGQSLAAVGDWVVIFDALDKVSPDDIEPDVARVRDSIKSQEGAATSDPTHPLAGLASGVMSGLLASGSWQRVSDYVTAHCSPPPSSAPAAATSPAAFTGIIAEQCNTTSLQLMAYDPTSGAITATRTFTADPSYPGMELCLPSTTLPGYVFRQGFNSDFTKMAASIPTGADGSQHIGTLDTNDHFTDLTPSDPGSYSDVPHQSNPVFNPATGRLWFVDTNANNYGSVDVNVGPSSSHPEAGSPPSSGGLAGGSGGFYFAPDGKTPLDDLSNWYDIYSPDGHIGVRYIPLQGFRVVMGEAPIADGEPTSPLSETAEPCFPKQFIDNTNFLCVGTPDSGLGLLKIAVQSPTQLTRTPIVPFSADHSIDDVTSNPDASQVAFISTLGNTQSLYVTPTSGANPNPRKLADVRSGELLLGWR